MDIIGTLGWRTDLDEGGVTRGLAALEAEIAAAMSAIEREDATVKIKADTTALERKLAEARKELSDFDRETMRLSQDRADALEADEKKVAEALGDELKERRAIRKEMVQTNKETSAELGILKNRIKEQGTFNKTLDAAVKKYGDLQTAHARTSAAQAKERAEIEKLRTAYQKLTIQQKALDTFKTRSFLGSDTDKQRLRSVAAEMNHVRSRIQALGGDFRDLDDDTERHAQTLGRLVSGLGSVRLQMGFTSLTVSQFGKALVILGPVINAVVGTASALVGVVGEGIAGAFFGGGAAVSAFALGFGGLLAAVSGAKEQLKAVKVEAKDMLQTFRGDTGAARTAFFSTVEATMGRLKSLLPTLADGTNDFAQGLQHAGDNFGAAFDQGEMKDFASTMLDLGADILPELGKAAGNVTSELASGFQDAAPWVEKGVDGILDWSKQLDISERDVDGFMKSLESTVHFVAAGGRTLWEFFTKGAPAGRDLLDDVTSGLDDLTSSIRSSDSLKGFFTDSVGLTEQVADNVIGLGENLFQLAQDFAPAAGAASDLLGVVLDLVHAMQQIPGLGTALNLALGGFLISKLPIIGGAITGLGTALGRKLLPSLAKTTVATKGGQLAFEGLGDAAAAAGGGAGATAGIAGMARSVLGFGRVLVRGVPVVGTFLAGLMAINETTDAFGGSSHEQFQSTIKEIDDFNQHLLDSPPAMREFAQSSEEAAAAVDDTFGAGTVAAISRTDRALAGYGAQVRNAATQMVTMGKLSRKQQLQLSVNLSDGDAQKKLSGLSQDLGKLGRGRQAIEIIANSGSAEQAIHRIEALLGKLKPKEVEIRADAAKAIGDFSAVEHAVDNIPKDHDTDVRADDGASSVADQVTSSILAVPTTHNTSLRAIDLASSVAAGVASVINSIPTSHTTTLYTTHVDRGKREGGPLVRGYASGGEVINSPKFMVGEEAPTHPEIVIATNPAYRDRNLGLLQLAAGMLGMDGFAKGGLPHPSKKSKVGALSVDKAQQKRDALQGQKDSLEERRKAVDQQLEQGRKANANKNKDDDVKGSTLKKYQGDIKQIDEKLHNLTPKLKQAKSNFNATSKANRRIETANAQIERDTSRMDDAADRGQEPKWRDAQKDLKNDLDKLRGFLLKQIPFLHGRQLAEVQDRLAQISNQRFTDVESLTAFPTEDAETLTADEQGRLEQIEAAVALAGLTDTPTDDIAANASLTQFWSTVLARLQGESPKNFVGIAEAAGALADARELSGAGSTAAEPTQAELFQGARQELYRSFAGNVRMGAIDYGGAGAAAAAARAPAVPAAQGGPGAGPAKQVNITNNYRQPPPDPHTWSRQLAHEAGSI